MLIISSLYEERRFDIPGKMSIEHEYEYEIIDESLRFK